MLPHISAIDSCIFAGEPNMTLQHPSNTLILLQCTATHCNTPLYIDEFCIEIWRESNPRGRKLWSLVVSDPNHSANRVYTIGTERSHHMWWDRSVPIVYTRLAEWSGSETTGDRSFLPRGFDSLRISMQNSSHISAIDSFIFAREPQRYTTIPLQHTAAQLTTATHCNILKHTASYVCNRILYLRWKTQNDTEAP